jgi:hypothetical protein
MAFRALAYAMGMTASVIVAGCATVAPSPGGPSEYLMPTEGFTMRLPPFSTIEIAQGARVPVVGTTPCDEGSCRVVVLPHRTASALRFLITSSGAFTGQAVNHAGSKMGFRYEPSPATVSLVPFAEEPPTIFPPEAHEEARIGLDGHLSRTLKDPASSQSYAASDIVPCNSVSMPPPNYRRSSCLCYEVNAKNSMGGYVGTQRHVVMLLTDKAPFIVSDMPDSLQTRGIYECAGMRPRSADLIRKHIQ